MAPTPPRLKVLSVGGNAVSAFLSWRLQATNACDVTLVWKSGFDTVSQYGISFKSKLFGNERFKPRHVVRSPEDATSRGISFDYVLLCVKALPDVYDLASVIESCVNKHTCILVNTTHTIGVESHLEKRFPTNVVLSIVSGAEINQLGASEFEHTGATDLWVGAANRNHTIPATIQYDMADALKITLTSGQVDCIVSDNIRQQQYERMIGPIAFHPASVLFETPSHAELLEKVGVRSMVMDVINELMSLATRQGCTFAPDFLENTVQEMTKPLDTNSIMYQDYTAKRPMEVETYLGSPIKLAEEAGVKVPRIETLYALLHHCNIVNQQRPAAPAGSPNTSAGAPPPRLSSVPPPRPPMNGHSMNGGIRGGRGGPMLRGRGPPPMGGYPSRQSNGYNPRPPPSNNQLSRRGSFDENDLGEFSHLVLYDDIPEGGVVNGYNDMSNGTVPSASELVMRERELNIRQRELQLLEQEQLYGRRRGPGRPPPPQSHRGGFDDDEEDDEAYFDPMAAQGPPHPNINTDNFDMMSVTSRKNRKVTSIGQIRRDPEMGRGPGPGSFRQSQSYGARPPRGNRSSQQLMASMPNLNDSLMENPMMGYSSNRYGNVDRKTIGEDSRTNSLTAARLNELQGAGTNPGMNGAYPSPGMPRRTSHSPGNPFNSGGGRMGRPSPPENGYMGPGGMPPNQRPSPPGMRQPIPRHPPGQGNAVAPHQVEQHAGVSNLYPPKGPVQKTVRSLTGSASASGSGESTHIDSEPSAHSSSSSLGPRQQALAAQHANIIGVQ